MSFLSRRKKKEKTRSRFDGKGGKRKKGEKVAKGAKK